MLDTITATRYVTPLKEGGSLPGIVEADDDGTYVVKFRGAGQGLKVLVAEVIVAGLAGHLGLRVPRLAVIGIPTSIARYEADEEVQDLLNASPGTNLAIDFLPGAFGYDGSWPPAPHEAALVRWLDAFTANVDRTWANPNLLVWHRNLWLIDHGAALYFHHGWPRRAPDPARFAALRFDGADHVLASVGPSIASVHDEASAALGAGVLADVVAQVPDEWLELNDWLPDAAAVRTAYVDHLAARLSAPAAWLGGMP
ncbi:MAG TPA: aminotransferase class I and II [Phycicoccus sp.]|nr:aminotransferase class I and II [Phycicoccus sp.]